MERPDDFSATMTKALLEKANMPPPDFYIPGDARYPGGTAGTATSQATYRGGGRELTRRHLYTQKFNDPVNYPEGPAYYAKNPFAISMKDMRSAGVSTKAFAEVKMKDFVGYKQNYYEREAKENPDRSKSHDIVNNKMRPVMAPPAVQEFQIKRLVEGVDGHPVQMGKLINLEAGSERGNHF